MELLRVAGLLSILVFGAHAVCKNSSSLTAFEQAVLDKHNELRRLHYDTDDLCYGETGEDISFYSQTWADEMAANKQMEHSTSSDYYDSSNPYGENLAMAGSSGAIAAEGEAYETSTTSWYSEISDWDFSSSASNGGDTGHFTQVVWKNSQQVNCGYATFYDSPFNKYYVVCQYYPAGNSAGQYAAQVAALASDGDDSNDTDDDDDSSDDSDNSSDDSSDDSNDSDDSSDDSNDDSSSCEPSYTATEGTSQTITSPDYPNEYPNSHDACTSVISAGAGQQVQLTFTDFQLEAASGCSGSCYDYVEVRNGDSSSSSLIGKYCGSSNPGTVSSTNGALWVRFYSDSSVTEVGFSANFEAVAGENESNDSDDESSDDISSSCEPDYWATNGTSQSISSPNYPDEYVNNNDNCISVIYAENGQQVRLEFADFELESASSCSGSCYDYVEVRNGNSASSSLIGQYCGSTVPATITSDNGALYVKFNSDCSVAEKGFLANFESVDSEDSSDSGGDEDGDSSSSSSCEPQYYATQGNPHSITSPNYPNEYPNSHDDCTSVIYAEDGEQVVLEFTNFDLESSSTCAYDYVEVRDGDSASSTLIGKYCGSTSPGSITSTSNALYVDFHSDSSVTEGGFYATYEAIVDDGSSSNDADDEADDTNCASVYNAVEGSPQSISSPDYPEEYPNSHDECKSAIYADSGYQVVLEFTHFELEAHSSCVYDYVEVRDGDSASAELIGRYCGTTSPGIITSTNGSLYVEFHSDSSVTEAGYFATFEALAEEQEVVVTWTTIEDTKLQGALTGRDYSLDEAKEACLADDSCVGVSCRGSTCMLNGNTSERSNSRYTAYVHDQ